MSRSRRKHPAGGIAVCDSEKADKVLAHRAYRKRVRQSLWELTEQLPQVRELSNPWCWGKDGKKWFGNYALSLYPKIVRK